jgi:peroxiredoxin Q/BCP
VYGFCQSISGQNQQRGRQGMKSLEGQKAPAFILEGNDGKRHSLEDYRGQKIVLFFYPKDSTPG